MIALAKKNRFYGLGTLYSFYLGSQDEKYFVTGEVKFTERILLDAHGLNSLPKHVQVKDVTNKLESIQSCGYSITNLDNVV